MTREKDVNANTQNLDTIYILPKELKISSTILLKILFSAPHLSIFFLFSVR